MRLIGIDRKSIATVGVIRGGGGDCEVGTRRQAHAELRMRDGSRQDDDARVRRISGWIVEDNLTRVVEYIASLVGCIWDDLDDGALEAGIVTTDADCPLGTWFEYPVMGTPELTLRIASNRGDGILSMTIEGEFDVVLAARFETLLDLH